MNIRNRFSMAVAGLAGAGLVVATGLLAGCPSQTQEQESAPAPVVRAAAFGGTVWGGQQPIGGAQIIVVAAATVPGAAPTVIGTATTTGSGRFGPITLSPAPATDQVVYALALGGNAGGGVNGAIGLMSVVGIGGSTLAPIPGTVNINELTTVVATSVLQDYIGGFTDCQNLDYGTWAEPAASLDCPVVPGATGLARMAVTFGNLADPETGRASIFLTAQPDGSPLHTTLEKLDTLANVLAACVNSAGATSGPCTGLFEAALNNPSDTLKAAWMIAAAPAVNQRAGALYALAPPAAEIFTPALTAAPMPTTAAGYWTVGGSRFAYGVNAGSGISVWRLSSLTGAMLPVTGGDAESCGTDPDPMNCFPDDNSLLGLALGPRGRYLYVANGTGNSVSAYSIATDGALSFIGAAPAGTQPLGIAVDPSGRYVYATNQFGHSVSAYRIGPTGALTVVGTTPVAATSPSAVVVDPTGSFVYVASSNFTANGYNISEYAIQPGGALSAIGAARAGSTPERLAITPPGAISMPPT